MRTASIPSLVKMVRLREDAGIEGKAASAGGLNARQYFE
jgi:hypothetical protein